MKIVNCTGLSLAMILLASTEVALSQPLIQPIEARVVSCPGQGWTKYPMRPQISRENLFCGEIKNGGKGFHSRPGGKNPATVTEFKVTQPANAAGIYGAQVTLSINGQTAQKSTTMFPDHCSKEEVLASVLYAEDHLTQCPSEAPVWARCGFSSPLSPGGSYCRGSDGKRFYIGMGFISNGNIKSAFPVYQK